MKIKLKTRKIKLRKKHLQVLSSSLGELGLSSEIYRTKTNIYRLCMVR